MLRSQYGVAASSSATPASHAEDAQPNETIYKRRHGLPPQIGSTWNNNHRGSELQRGSHRGSWTQYGIRGSRSWRGRGNFQSHRGGDNSNQRQTGHIQRSTHHTSVPPIATLPDIEHHMPQTSSPWSSSSPPSSSQIKPTDQPSMPDSPVIRESRQLQTEPHYKLPPDEDEVHVRPFSAPSFSERQVVDEYHWLRRSRSPSPKLPPSSLKRRKIKSQHTHFSNSGRNEDLAISQPIKYHSLTAEAMPPKADKPLLPGRHRRFEGSAPILAPHSLEPLVQVKTVAVSPIKPNIPAETSSIKQEPRTPSPSLRMERSLITSSCKFYPIPEFCKKSCSGFKEGRKVFFREKMQELQRLGLKRVRAFFRDDGLVIEWESKVPVWSDTLLPDFPDLASAIKRAHQINHQTSATPTPKRKRQSDSLKDNNNANGKASEPNESKRLRLFLENTQRWAAEIEMVALPTMPLRISSSPTPTSSLDRHDRPPTTLTPHLDTSKLICFDPEVVPDIPVVGDAEPLNIITSVIQQQTTSAMDVDTPTPTQPPKPVRRMLFKPVHPLRKNQPMASSVQDSILLTSDSAKPLSTSPSAAEGHSKKDQIQVDSRQNDVLLQEKTGLPRPRPPLPSLRRRHSPHYTLPVQQPLPTVTQNTSTQGASKSCTPTPPTPPPLRIQVADEVNVQEARASPVKDEDCGNATDADAELVVSLLLRGTPEEPNNLLSTSRQEEVMEDFQFHAGHEAEEYDEEDKDHDEPSVLADEDTVAVEGLATQFLQRYLQLFDVDRLKLEAAYAKNALFSCRVHHVQEPSFSMAGLFAPERNGGRQWFNVSRSRASISAIQKGRAQIVNRLLELGPHSFCPRGVPRTVNYDVVLLSSTTGGGILLTVHGEVVNPHLEGPQMDHILSVDQSFVLRKRELDDEGEGMDGFGQTISSTATSNHWPLVAVSHQMTVRDAASLPLEQLDGLLSRIRGS